jgi:hypothetical protein
LAFIYWYQIRRSNLLDYKRLPISQEVEDPLFNGLDVLTENEVKLNDVLMRKLAVRYGEFPLLPGADIIIVDYNFEEPWKSEILAILSCVALVQLESYGFP